MTAGNEIETSLRWSKFALRFVGVSLKPENSNILSVVLALTVSILGLHTLGDLMYFAQAMSGPQPIAKIAQTLPFCGYTIQCICKLLAVWYKRDVFIRLFEELADMWPKTSHNKKARALKKKSLKALRITHFWYCCLSGVGLSIYFLRPIFKYLYELIQGVEDAEIGYVWYTWYPFNKNQHVIVHVLVYLLEVIIGIMNGAIFLGTDMLFTAMASHIALQLKLLNEKVQCMPDTSKNEEEQYKEIVNNIKLHQRLIKYCFDLEDTFTVSNFVNYVLSSINICCVLFSVLILEPLLELCSKLFLVSALGEIGMICWYGDEIMTANQDIAMAVYKSKWYRLSPKCKKALLLFLQRAQKPIALTAMKFTTFSLVTYYCIVSRSYTYFALLSSVYKQ